MQRSALSRVQQNSLKGPSWSCSASFLPEVTSPTSGCWTVSLSLTPFIAMTASASAGKSDQFSCYSIQEIFQSLFSVWAVLWRPLLEQTEGKKKSWLEVKHPLSSFSEHPLRIAAPTCASLPTSSTKPRSSPQTALCSSQSKVSLSQMLCHILEIFLHIFFTSSLQKWCGILTSPSRS